MNIEYFYYFIEAAHEMSLSKAARNYHISQQGMSRAMKQLETEYGVTLFDRSMNTITLTDAGQVFLEESQNLVSSHNCLKDALSVFREKGTIAPKSTLQVYATLNVALNIWPLIAKMLDKNDVHHSISLKELPQERIARKMSSLADSNAISIVTISSLYKDLLEMPALKFEYLLDIELMAKVGKNSKFAQRGIVTTEDMLHSRLALYDDRGLNAMLEHLLPDSDALKRNICIQTSNLQMIDDEILHYDAIGFSNSFVRSFSDSGSEFRIIPFEKTFRTPAYMVTSSVVPLSDAAQALADAISDVVSTYYSRARAEKGEHISYPVNITRQVL